MRKKFFVHIDGSLESSQESPPTPTSMNPTPASTSTPTPANSSLATPSSSFPSYSETSSEQEEEKPPLKKEETSMPLEEPAEELAKESASTLEPEGQPVISLEVSTVPEEEPASLEPEKEETPATSLEESIAPLKNLTAPEEEQKLNSELEEVASFENPTEEPESIQEAPAETEQKEPSVESPYITQKAESKPISYTLYIKGIERTPLKEKVEAILLSFYSESETKAFLQKDFYNGVLTLKSLHPSQASMLVQRLKDLPLDLDWKQIYKYK